MPRAARPRVLFVGDFDDMPGGGRGGFRKVSATILQSPLAERYHFVLLTSTARSLPPPRWPLRSALALRRFLKFLWLVVRCDAVLLLMADGPSILDKSTMAAVARLLGKGVVLRPGSGRVPAQCARSRVLRGFFRLGLRSADVVCSQGPFWTAFLASFPETRGKIVETPNAVEIPALAPRAGRKGVPRLLFVGWLLPDKGIYELLQAMPAIRATVPGALLETVGGGGELARFRAHVEKAGLAAAVIAHGWLPHDQVLQRMQECDVFVLPSYAEGMPNALLEAMAEGMACVVTRVGAVPDFFRDGEHALLIEPRDAEAIARKVVTLLQDENLRQRLGAAARARVREKFDAEVVWRRFETALGRATGTGDLAYAAAQER